MGKRRNHNKPRHMGLLVREFEAQFDVFANRIAQYYENSRRKRRQDLSTKGKA